jgi:uncharacterized protein YceH (UPF0502 family)
MEDNLPDAPPLTPVEARILGCLLEKELATPDIYPLTLNALGNACNQRNNRAPLMEVEADVVGAGVAALRERHLVALFAGADARVPKYRQTLDTVHPLDPVGRSLVAELLLRGPQTAAGLRANGERMTAMPALAEVELRLTEMAERGLVVRLPRLPGQKEARWAQLMTGTAEASSVTETTDRGRSIQTVALAPLDLVHRVDELAARLENLEAELARLRQALGE